MSRLQHLDATLAQLAVAAAPGTLRDAVLLACTAAIGEAGGDDPDVVAAVLALRRGEEPDPARQRMLDQLVQALDERAWTIQESGSSAGGDYDAAFRRARAVAAVATATHGPGMSVEALYEAHFAVEDSEALTRKLVANLKGGEPPVATPPPNGTQNEDPATI